MTHTSGMAVSRLAATLVLTASISAAQEPTLRQVLVRATDHVDLLNTQLAGVVAEERYEQRATTPRTTFDRFPGDTNDTLRRTLRSDYLLVQPRGSDRYYGFRDVFEVDGRPVRDREERLAELFLDPSASADRQIHGILSDSARYNIGNVERNFNTPTLALLFLRDSYKPRFSFERTFETSPGLGIDTPDVTGDVWVVAYTESWPTTVIRGRGRENLPASGRFWIEAGTGRVLVSELTLNSPEIDVTVTVRYHPDARLGHLVPAEMRERYQNRTLGSRVEGTATYSHFRRFQVHVDESEPFRN